MTRYTATSLADISGTFSRFAEDLEHRATHAPTIRERQILAARAGIWREAAQVLDATTIEEPQS